jgi:hypothetical protein
VGQTVDPLGGPLTLPSPPGRRGEREKGASLEPGFGGKPFFKDCPSTFLDSPALGGEGWGAGFPS